VDLHADLVRREDVIALTSQAYNLSVQSYNNAVQTVPTNIVAWIASFAPRDFLSAAASEHEVPGIDFDLPAAAARR
jgi:LemA protein